MQAPDITLRDIQVAPVRERGLKCSSTAVEQNDFRRSRKGAWIEIATLTWTTADNQESLP